MVISSILMIVLFFSLWIYTAFLKVRNKQLREALSLALSSLRKIGDDYPGSSSQSWCAARINDCLQLISGEKLLDTTNKKE